MMKEPSRCAVAIIVAGLGLGMPAAADDVSRWDGDARSAVRLVAGSRLVGVSYLRAGVEIRLKPGWHTYWRYPGDAGVPPQFDFAQSQNVKHIDVMWPAPQRLVEAGGVSIGYLRGVLFPLRVVPQDATRPVGLRLKLDYAICEKLCVPADGRAELALTGGRSGQDGNLVAAEGRVPKKMRLGEGGELAIKSVRREATSGKPRVLVDVAGPAGVDLFAEGPTPQWALPVPEPIAGAPAGLQRFAFELDGAPTGASYEGITITLTAVTPAAAVEVTTRLD
jgi:DsbC/DsbD-like thiol-disulfide interchange protein